MKSQWPYVELGSIAEFRNGLNYTQAARRSGGLPIVGVKDFQSRSFVEFDGLEELDTKSVDPGDLLVRKDDILFVRSNGNRQLIGRSLLVRSEPSRPTTFSGFTIRLRLIDDRCDSNFYAYVLRGPLIRKLLSSQGGGTNISNLNQAILSRLAVPLPTRNVQHRIASILGAYDDLIEVNRRRMVVLQEMASRLFEEWFIRLRFPGYESSKAIKSQGELVPQGWEMLPLSRIAMKIGKSVSPSESPDQLFNHYSFPAFDEAQIPASERGETILSDKLLFSESCVLIGKLNPRIPRIWYADIDGDLPHIASTEFIPLKPFGAATLGLLYGYVTSEKLAGKMRSFAQGASTSHQRVKPDDVLNTLVPVPPDKVLKQADQQLAPLYELIATIRRANARLLQARDLLLPRLVSNEISVKDAELELEAVA